MKFLKRITVVLVSAFALLILYIEFGGKYVLDIKDRQLITWTMRSTQKLPENFTGFYGTVYPKYLSTNSWDQIINSVFNSNTSIKNCPCSQTSYFLYPRKTFKSQLIIKYHIISRYIELHYSQKDCLNFNFSTFDFLENRKGISDISQSLFNKNTKDLSPIEMAEILALYENPLKNSRNKNPERAKKRTAYFYNLYSKNLTK
ncbi:transglycosylase [Chryseobacterium sp. 52]|uniref:transglycosylase domain-containing protein n=1 Tax=Chryseobacterium sp. 52 TaxID=2035213 RepID=UPI000C1799B4|nr:transglycosylase domain-containing protein [Chryseobacterium sp. 52]PIF44855.1 transglycosylase [Chryseobacterium sp. 52]